MLFILAIALADNVFRDYSTAEDIFAIGAPSLNEGTWQLLWKDTMLDVHFFQPMTPDIPNGSILKGGSFSDQLTASAKRSGYKNITVHYARRKTLDNADCMVPILTYLYANNSVRQWLLRSQARVNGTPTSFSSHICSRAALSTI